MKIELTIAGRPIAKKNSKRIFARGGRVIALPSAAYEKFKTSAVAQLKQQMGKVYIDQYCHLDLIFCVQGKYHVDLDNLISSVCDLLQDAGVIKDDDLFDSIYAKKIGGCGGWSTKVILETYETKN
jgi:Holliday junction resolvase RusA-like endonuclease